MGAVPTDWVNAYLKVRERGGGDGRGDAESGGEARRRGQALAGSPRLRGTYEDACTARSRSPSRRRRRGQAGHALRQDAGPRRDMEHWSRETFVVRWRDRALRADAYVTFSLDRTAPLSKRG